MGPCHPTPPPPPPRRPPKPTTPLRNQELGTNRGGMLTTETDQPLLPSPLLFSALILPSPLPYSSPPSYCLLSCPSPPSYCPPLYPSPPSYCAPPTLLLPHTALPPTLLIPHTALPLPTLYYTYCRSASKVVQPGGGEGWRSTGTARPAPQYCDRQLPRRSNNHSLQPGRCGRPSTVVPSLYLYICQSRASEGSFLYIKY
jgi:hypothetical protein